MNDENKDFASLGAFVFFIIFFGTIMFVAFHFIMKYW